MNELAQSPESSSGVAVSERNPFLVAGLTFVTFCLYGFYWWYDTNRQLAELGKELQTDELGDSPLKSLLAVSLGALIVVPAALSLVGTSQRIKNAERLAGVQNEAFLDQSFSVLGSVAVCILFPPFGLMYLQTHINRIWVAGDWSADPGRALSYSE